MFLFYFAVTELDCIVSIRFNVFNSYDKIRFYFYYSGERRIVYTFRSVGSGIGPETLEPVLTAVSTIFAAL